MPKFSLRTSYHTNESKESKAWSYCWKTIWWSKHIPQGSASAMLDLILCCYIVVGFIHEETNDHKEKFFLPALKLMWAMCPITYCKCGALAGSQDDQETYWYARYFKLRCYVRTCKPGCRRGMPRTLRFGLKIDSDLEGRVTMSSRMQKTSAV